MRLYYRDTESYVKLFKGIYSRQDSAYRAKTFDSVVNFRTFILLRNEHKCYMKISCKLHRCLSNRVTSGTDAYVRMKTSRVAAGLSQKSKGKQLVTFPNLVSGVMTNLYKTLPFSVFVSQGKGRNKGEGGRSLTVIPIEDWLHSGDAAIYVVFLLSLTVRLCAATVVVAHIGIIPHAEVYLSPITKREGKVGRRTACIHIGVGRRATGRKRVGCRVQKEAGVEDEG